MIHPVLTIDMYLSLKPLEEDIVMSKSLQYLYANPSLLGDVIMQDWELTRVLIEESILKRSCLIEGVSVGFMLYSLHGV